MVEKLKGLLLEEEGQGMVEYGLIIALVALVAGVGIAVFGETVREFFNDLDFDPEQF